MTATGTSVVSVTAYAAQIARAVRAAGGAVVEGEVQRPKATGRGMLCFDLTDGDSKLACKVFAGQVRRLEHQPRHGDLVQVVVERPDFWPAAGKLDLIAVDVRLAGEGELLRRRAELLGRLRAEGLCDEARRKPLPRFPRAVGVIAGRGSDGMADVVQALRDRFPPVHVVACPALVQGKAAPRDLIDALAHLQEHPLVDAIVIARGGGSVQDLVAFDDERLCRAIFACAKPVVAAIGHTENVPVCNHVAWAAFTPSRSAELVVPAASELRQDVGAARVALAGVAARVERLAERVGAATARGDARALLDARAATVRERAAAIGVAERAFVGDRERVVADARAVLARVPHRLPTGVDVATASARLDVRATAFFRDRADALAAAARGLASVGGRVEVAAGDVDEHGRRLRVGTRRQLEDHERDYGRALARLGREAAAAVARALARERERLERVAGVAGERARRRLADAQRDARLAAAVVAGKDFRRLGWVLAGRAGDGAPVRGAAELRPGERVRLAFSDGRAEAVVDTTTMEDPT
jgi:exodeoxyribonuclease VII large subunit